MALFFPPRLNNPRRTDRCSVITDMFIIDILNRLPWEHKWTLVVLFVVSFACAMPQFVLFRWFILFNALVWFNAFEHYVWVCIVFETLMLFEFVWFHVAIQRRWRQMNCMDASWKPENHSV